VRTTTQAATFNSPSTRGRERGKVTRRHGVSLDLGERDDADEIEDVVREEVRTLEKNCSRYIAEGEREEKTLVHSLGRSANECGR
jgi:hypothetical protein